MKKFIPSKEKIMDTMSELGSATKKMTDDMADKTREGKKLVEEKYEKMKYEYDLKTLRPIFENDLSPDLYSNSTVIRIVNYDKRMENDVCQGAVGFEEKIRQANALCLYSRYAEKTGINFYPAIKESVYCVNPYNENMYICIDDYFDYIKKAKIAELENVAYSLGAKHIKISFKEKKKTFSLKNSKINIPYKDIINVGISHGISKDDLEEIRVETDAIFEGNDIPSEPTLTYFKEESDIVSLIKMRTDTESQNKIKSKTYLFEYCRSQDMQENTAADIDSIVKKLGISANSSVENQVQSSKKMVLEYSIEF